MKTPITNYETPKLATHTYIIIDVEVAIKAYHLIYNKPEKWRCVIIHLGDFHSFMAFFDGIGKFVAGGAFEDILYQSNFCDSRSLNTPMSGKHYNRCCRVHENISEVIKRLVI